MTEEGKPLTVVADDDDDILALMAATLASAGLDVVTAQDGKEALRLVSERKPRLVVLDVAMPGLDGIEVLRRLRAEPATADVPVIIVSARAQEDDVARAYADGVSKYIRKPFSPRDLAAAARELVS